MSNSIQTAYERDGFYIRERLLTEAECADLKTEAMRVMREHAKPAHSVYVGAAVVSPVFYKLAETSGRSMARMRNITPRMKALQERYADNREELGKQMMELYKREKVNPVAGCLPMLVQIPVGAKPPVITESAEAGAH